MSDPADDQAEERPEWYRPPAPYEPGNVAALKHGAFSPRRYEPLAGELVDQVLERAMVPHSSTAYLAEPSYRPALWAWARCEAKVQLFTEWLLEHGGDIDEDGTVRGAAAQLERVERRGITLRARLGLDPLSRAKLGADVASAGGLSVAQLMAALGREDDEDGGDDGGR